VKPIADLRSREEAIFRSLERAPNDRTFLGRLYRDGIPTPALYFAQRIPVLFVFREPNMRGGAYAHDMRDEVSDPYFRPLASDGSREDRSMKCWWNWKAGMFAHAVAAALDEERWTTAFARFNTGGWNHDVVNRFAYIQIKKVGGGGTSNRYEICAHAEKYKTVLKQQVDLYRPLLVLGCGVGPDSPARLLAAHMLVDGREATTRETKATWWEFSPRARPRAMVQLWHPARRRSKAELYQDVWSSVNEVVHAVGLACGEGACFAQRRRRTGAKSKA
jgi:hypothetical protein